MKSTIKIVIAVFFVSIFSTSFAGEKRTGKKASASDVRIGLSEGQLVRKLGNPDSRYVNGKGRKVYLYTEKIMLGSRTVEERKFEFIIQGGRIIDINNERIRRAPRGHEMRNYKPDIPIYPEKSNL
jgi:hypothetical protein